MKNTSILIIDDEIKLTRSLAFTLKQAGFECFEAFNGAMGCELARRESPDVVLLDIRMPGMSGLEALEQLRVEAPDTPVVMMSAFDDTANAVQAIKMGAVDYLSKPFDVDELILLLKETNSKRQLELEVRYLREQSDRDNVFIGISAEIRALREQLKRVADSRVMTLLLMGETGVGKQVVARELHRICAEEGAPFVEINCAMLPENLIEVELFGADRNALPGVGMKRRGLIELADNGTLLLDEVGEMPLSIQAKLLTFLETRAFRPVGGMREHSANVRVIAATNSDLEAAVECGAFRRDLYYRLSVMPIEIPPLRERDKDIDLLIDHFSGVFAKDAGGGSIAFTRAARAVMNAYPWPGNVRELKNLIERLTILRRGEVITENDLPHEFHAVEPAEPLSIEESMHSVERHLVQDALMKSGGRKGVAAERLGISRHALKRKMHKLGLS